MFKVKDKYSMTKFWCFYCWLWPQSAYQYSASTFNFEQVFVSRVWKNILKTKKRYICFVIKVANKAQWFIFAPNWKKIMNKWPWYEHVMNIIWTYVSAYICSRNPKCIIIVSSRFLICSIIAISQRFNLFLLYQTENMWNKLVGI